MPAPPQYIPYSRLATFVNRTHELDQLLGWAEAPRGAILSIVGMGGIGKTALMAEFLYRHAGTLFPGGVFWLNGRQNLTEELASIAKHHGIGDAETTETTASARVLLDKIGQSEGSLLVVDDLDRPNLIHEDQEGLPPLASLGAAIATTTRLRLVQTSDVLRLELENLDSEAAATLLSTLAGPQFRSSAHVDEHIQSLVGELGGNALAIRIVGNLVSRQALAPAEILFRLRESTESHLHATLKRAYDSIPDAFTLGLLTLLSSLPEEYPLTKSSLPLLYGGISAVALAQTEKALRWLEGLSLISMQEDETVRIHPLVRSFVRGVTPPAEMDRLASTAGELARAAVMWSTSHDLSKEPPLVKPKVFLCYSGADRPVVEKLYKRLHSDGFAPWMDKLSLLPGQDWEMEVERAIHGADFFVACISKRFVGRSYAHKEIHLALAVYETMPEGTIYLIPARIEDVSINDRRLASKQWVDLFEADGYDRLVASLRAAQPFE